MKFFKNILNAFPVLLGTIVITMLLNGCMTSEAIRPENCLDGPLTVLVCDEEPLLPIAEDFAMHLRLITGSKIPLNPSDVRVGSYVIRITQRPKDIPEEDLLPEEARWSFGRDGAVFYGQGPLGPSHAVYKFLEEELGFRWPTPWDIIVPRRQSFISFNRTECNWIPPLASRLIHPANGQKTNPAIRLWYRRMRAGGHDMPPYGHPFADWWKKYGKEHPDYFALVNDKREPVVPNEDEGNKPSDEELEKAAATISLCPTNPAVAKQIVDDWDKKSPYISVCENPSPAEHACHCEKCRALDPHPMQEFDEMLCADRYVHMANEVLKLARQYNPEVKVTMKAINATQESSVNIKLDPGVLIELSPREFTITAIEKQLKDWHESGMRDFKYKSKYHWYFMSNGYPVGHARHFFNIFQTIFHNGAIYFEYDAPDDGIDLFRIHSDYILMHAMNAPDVSFERWERDFAQAFAGEAAVDILKYFHQWEHLWDSKIVIKLHENTTKDNNFSFSKPFSKDIEKYYTDTDFAIAGVHLDNALKNPALTKEERQRINSLKLFNDHATLLCKAVTTKNPWDVSALRDFRRDHNMPALMPYELSLGDFCGISAIKDLHFEQPVVQLPLFWHFKLDPDDSGEVSFLQNNVDFSFWDGLMPTDAPWNAPKESNEHPSKELRQKCSSYHGVAWYACEIEIPLNWKDRRRVFVHFNAVDKDAKVWLNGNFIGYRQHSLDNDSVTPFDLEITDHVDWTKKKQLLTVKVRSDEGDGGIWNGSFIGSIFKK